MHINSTQVGFRSPPGLYWESVKDVSFHVTTEDATTRMQTQHAMRTKGCPLRRVRMLGSYVLVSSEAKRLVCCSAASWPWSWLLAAARLRTRALSPHAVASCNRLWRYYASATEKSTQHAWLLATPRRSSQLLADVREFVQPGQSQAATYLQLPSAAPRSCYQLLCSA